MNQTDHNTDKAALERKAKMFIWIVSIAIPVAVTVMYFMPKIEAGSSFRGFLNHLPLFNALNNAATAVVLFLALVAIKRKNVALHKKLMTGALVLSAFFLVSYVMYHSTSDSTAFPKEDPLRVMYLIVLFTHIVISAIIVPLVLVTYSRALAERFDKHKKLAKITWPLWFYVAITGVIVYLMISPYYPF
jgi:putative membrane protein